MGKRFADGYTQQIDTGFYQVSPSMTVDASTCYLPEHTWLIEDFHHGMTYKDEYTRELMFTLLLNDESYDVHSLEKYPQFHATTNLSHSVFAYFNNCTEGYLTADSTELVVKNLSKEKTVTVLAVNVYGTELELANGPMILKPGQSGSYAIEGEIPQGSVMNFEVSLSYLIDTVTLMGERTFNFTLMNGEKAEYDAENPYVEADNAPAVDSVLDEDTNAILTKYGVKNLVSIVYNIVKMIIDFVNKIIEMF